MGLGVLNRSLEINQTAFAPVALGCAALEATLAKALFFGRLRDQAGVAERDVALGAAVELADFRRLASAGDEDLAVALAAPSIRIAVNAVLAPVATGYSISPNDDVAFMPPFSGG